MRRKFTVYGLRFSKTSVWNHINTGFPDPAVATVLTACGIETNSTEKEENGAKIVATVLTACGIETSYQDVSQSEFVRQLQQYLPLAVLKPITSGSTTSTGFAGCNSTYRLRY